MAQLNLSMSPGDRSQIRQAAQTEGKPISVWMVEAARKKLGLPDETDDRFEELEGRVSRLEGMANL